jgi:hypothetical protein
LINELGYLMDDAGGVTVACEDITSFNDGVDRVMVCSEDLSERPISLIVSVNLVSRRFYVRLGAWSVRGRFSTRLCNRLDSVEVGRKR